MLNKEYWKELVIQNETREIPIIMFKKIDSPSVIISNIVNGEFKRNKEISAENYIKTMTFIQTKPYISPESFIEEKELNNIINEALGILYGKN